MKIAFILKGGRKARLRQKESYPDDFFFGYFWLKKNGVSTELIEQTEIGASGEAMSLFMALLSRVFLKFCGVHIWVVFRLARKKVRNILQKFDFLVVTTSTLGIALLVLKYFGLIPRPRICFVIMGLGDLTCLPLRNFFLKRLVKKGVIVAISKGEIEHLHHTLGSDTKIYYLPFGVDHTFWKPAENDFDNNYILSIGNDPSRDFQSLISAWKPEYPLLKIITKQTIQVSTDNIEIIKGSWQEQILSDREVREMIQNAMFLIVPVSQTSQPSGQSVCLQGMACGKPVIMANTFGLWDRQLMCEENGCILYHPEDVDSLSDAIERLLFLPDKIRDLGQRARSVIENNLNSENTGKRILSLFEDARH